MISIYFVPGGDGKWVGLRLGNVGDRWQRDGDDDCHGPSELVAAIGVNHTWFRGVTVTVVEGHGRGVIDLDDADARQRLVRKVLTAASLSASASHELAVTIRRTG